MLPKVRENEEKKVFIKRCVTFIKKEIESKTTDEALEICLTEWDFRDTVLETDRPDSSLILENEINVEKKEQEIKIFPKKKVYIQKYKKEPNKGYINFNDEMFDEIILNFNNPDLFKPFIDESHKLGVSYATILELINKDDGLYAKIELNDIGIEAIKNNRFSYISPFVGSREDTNKVLHNNVLCSVTLTNIPALEGELPKLQDQIKLTKMEESMEYKEILELIETKLSTFSLETETPETEQELQTEVPMEVVNELLTLAQTLVASIEEAITGKGEAEKATEEAIKEKEEMERVAEDATTELSKIKLEAKSEEKNTFFKELVSNGQVEMNELELWKQHYDENEEFVVKVLTTRPEIEEIQLSNSLELEDNDLSEEDKFIMTSTGYDKNNKEDVVLYKSINKGEK